MPKETAAGEHRVALVPDVVRRLAAAGHEVVIEPGAGAGAGIADDAFADAGAELGDPWGAQVIARVAPAEPGGLTGDHVLIGFLAPLTNSDGVAAIARTGATAFAMEAIPRISRAQSMDALSSQATVSGYLSVIIAAGEMPRFLPMLMTAAGTIPPAQVLVLGAGVAGLQAIATARRLGAIVEAYDVRAATKEQIQSLGAKFVDTGVAAEGTGGYARELTADEKAKQQEILDRHIAKADIVITTAAIPGRTAPRIISKSAVEAMGSGAVIVDLAAESGGNCELTVAGETIVTPNGVSILGPRNLPSELARHSSQMYARNLLNFLTPALKNGELAIDWQDEVFAQAVLTHDGQIRHAATAKLLEGR